MYDGCFKIFSDNPNISVMSVLASIDCLSSFNLISFWFLVRWWLFNWSIDFCIFCYGTLDLEASCFLWLSSGNGRGESFLLLPHEGTNRSSMFSFHWFSQEWEQFFVTGEGWTFQLQRGFQWYLLDERGRIALLLLSRFPSLGWCSPYCYGGWSGASLLSDKE